LGRDENVPGERLHQFDVALCINALDNVRAYMDDPAFAAYVEEQVEPPVLAYLKALGDGDEPEPMLLTDRELAELAETFWGGPLEFDRAWVPYMPLHRRAIDCVLEVRASLASEYAEEWARASARFAEQLEGERVRLGGGIEVVGAWVGEVRRYLRAMNAMAWLPAPEGAFPTPTNPAPAAPAPPASTRGGLTATEGGPGHVAPADPPPGIASVLERLAVALDRLGAPPGPQAPAAEALCKTDAAAFLGVDVPTIEYLIRAKKLEFVQYGTQRGRVIPVASLRQFLEQHRQVTAEEFFKNRAR
jgi:excisionase family DNA binding protein